MNLSVRLLRVRAATFVVTVAGDLDLYSASLLSPFLVPPPGPGPRHIVLAAARLSFCDVAGSRLLTCTHQILRGTGGGLVIAGAPGSLRRLTALVAGRPADAPAHHADVAEALRACAAPGVEDAEDAENAENAEDAAGSPYASRHLPSFRGLGAGRGACTGARVRRRT